MGHLSKQKNYNKYVDGIDAGMGNYRAFETMQDKTDDEWVETLYLRNKERETIIVNCNQSTCL